jgi:cysteinyl-tRNA synthetase
MRKAVNLENSFDSFIRYCQAYINEHAEMPILENIDENEIFSKLNQTKLNVEQALCDDFNTCSVIIELQELIKYINKIFKASLERDDKPNLEKLDLNRHYGCIAAVASYVEEIFNILGIDFRSEDRMSSVCIY